MTASGLLSYFFFAQFEQKEEYWLKNNELVENFFHILHVLHFQFWELP